MTEGKDLKAAILRIGVGIDSAPAAEVLFYVKEVQGQKWISKWERVEPGADRAATQWMLPCPEHSEKPIGPYGGLFSVIRPPVVAACDFPSERDEICAAGRQLLVGCTREPSPFFPDARTRPE